jgi:4'-phosphopantetheinyl transferase
VHVYWLQQALPDLPAGDDWLTADESARLAALHVPKRRADWRLGRWTAKLAVASYLKRQLVAPQIPAANLGHREIELRPAPSGAPEVFLRSGLAPVTISLTHSSGMAVCAVGPPGITLGCDLELIEPRSRAFVVDYFTGEEQAVVAESSSAVRDRLITLIWSAKESALKALRTGLRLDTRDVVVTPDLQSGGEWRPLEVRCASGEAFSGWWCEDDNSVLTLVAAPPPSPPTALDAIRRYDHTPA